MTLGDVLTVGVAVIVGAGHRNLHALIGPLFNGLPMPKGGTRRERAVALDAHARWVAMGSPGSPHAAYGIHGPEIAEEGRT